MIQTFGKENALALLEEKIDQMNLSIITPTVQFWNFRSEFDVIIKIKENMLEFAKLNYDYQTQLIDIDEHNEDLFAWKNNSIKIWCIGVKKPQIKTRALLFFATRSDIDEIETINVVEETSTPAFLKLDSLEKISFLMDKELIPDISSELIKTSINSQSSIGSWVVNWVDDEKRSIDTLVSSSHELFEFNKAIIRAKRYSFEEMLSTINNEQFTMEFDECLYAYNNQKWFTCAAGLGGVLEHLLYLILEKNQMIDSNFPDDATAKIYIDYLSRNPIKIKKRDKTYIRTLFMTRNSVSHFNQGFTSKDQCTHLMNGIKDLFNNYYIKDFNLEAN